MLDRLIDFLFLRLFAKQLRFGNYRLIYDRSCRVHIEGILKLSCDTRLGQLSIINVAKNAELCLGRNVCFSRGVLIEVPSGSNSTISDNVKLGAFSEFHGDVSIGEYTLIAPFVFASSGSHNYPSDSQPIRELDRASPIPSRPVTIGNNCWICKSVHILPGKHIGSNSIISASTIVTSDVPSNSLLKSYQSYSIKPIVNKL